MNTSGLASAKPVHGTNEVDGRISTKEDEVQRISGSEELKHWMKRARRTLSLLLQEFEDSTVLGPVSFPLLKIEPLEERALFLNSDFSLTSSTVV